MRGAPERRIAGDSGRVQLRGSVSMQAVANECLLQTPPHHSIFSHTIHSRTYTFIIDHPFVYFAVSDSKLPKPNRVWFLKRFKEAAQHQIAKHGKSILKSNRSFTSYCFQSQIQPILHHLMSTHGVETEANGMDKGRVACKTQSKRIFAMRLKKKKIEMSDQIKVTSRDEGDSGSGAKHKAKGIWRRHVWVILGLDSALCLILFGVWLMVCHGFQCIQ